MAVIFDYTTVAAGSFTPDDNPSFTISRSSEYDDARNRTRTLISVTVTGRLYIGDGAFDVQIPALEAKIIDGGTLTITKNGQVAHQFTDCRVPAGISYPDGLGELATIRSYEFALEAEVIANEDGIEFEKWTWAYDQNNLLTLSLEGRLKDSDEPPDARSKAEARDPQFQNISTVPLVPYVTSDMYRTGYNMLVDPDNTTVNYSFTYRQSFLDPPFPADVTDGKYQDTRVLDGHTIRTRRTGSYTGGGAEAAALGLNTLVGARAITSSITTDLFTGTTSFSYEFLSSPDPRWMMFQETTSWSQGGTDFRVYKRPGGAPFSQDLLDVPATAEQRGSAVGFSSYPTPPDPLWDADKIRPGDKVITKDSPKKGPDGLYTEYRISWSYRFTFFETTITEHDPNSP